MRDNKAVIYVRVSTTKASQKDSPEHQKGICEEKARELGLNVQYPVYEDRDTGTSIVARPAIRQLIEDAREGRFRTVLFASLSRFSRDTYDSLGLKRILVDTLGLRLVSLDENYDSDVDKDEFKFQIISAVNQKLSEQISLSSKRGIRQSALKGNFTGSITPYGYKKALVQSRKTLVPDEATMDVVKRIYQMYVHEKKGEKAIVNVLNQERIPACRGGRWGLSSVQRILTNEVYTGENVFGKYETKQVYYNIQNMFERGKKQVRRKAEDWERTGFKTHEAIIDDETFRKAQEIRLLRGGGRRGGRKAHVNVFAGLMVCKHCGTAIVSMKSKSRAGEYRYLMCSKRRRQGEAGCVNDKWIPYDEFRDRLISQISFRLQKLVDADKISTETVARLPLPSLAGLEKEAGKYNKLIEDNRRLLFGIRKQKLLNEIGEQQYLFEKELVEEEIRIAQERLEQLRRDAGRPVDKERLRTHIKQAIHELVKMKNVDRMDAAKLILGKLIHKIVVHRNGEIEVYSPLGRIQ